MCIVVSRPMKIVTFLRKNGYSPKRVVDSPLERNTFRHKIMEIVKDFDEKNYNNNGKPWKSSRIFRVKPNCFIFSLFFFIFIFHFLHFFIFCIFHFFNFFFIFLFFHFFTFGKWSLPMCSHSSLLLKKRLQGSLPVAEDWSLRNVLPT